MTGDHQFCNYLAIPGTVCNKCGQYVPTQDPAADPKLVREFREADATPAERLRLWCDAIQKDDLAAIWPDDVRKVLADLAASRAMNGRFVADIMGMQDGSLLRDTQHALAASQERVRELSEPVAMPEEPEQARGRLEVKLEGTYSGTDFWLYTQYAAALRAWAARGELSGWQPIETAPKDGTTIIAWCVHENAKYSKAPIAEGWEAAVIAKWIDHNGGGWCWHGHAGTFTKWKPLPAPPALGEGKP